MVRRKNNSDTIRRLGQSLIASRKIKAESWRMSATEVQKALQAQGYKVKEIKKIRHLKHQICISYYDQQGGVCSGFFSYRIFERWQIAVETLVFQCDTLVELLRLKKLIEYEYSHYPYPVDMQDAINTAIETRTLEFKAMETAYYNFYPQVS